MEVESSRQDIDATNVSANNAANHDLEWVLGCNTRGIIVRSCKKLLEPIPLVYRDTVLAVVS